MLTIRCGACTKFSNFHKNASRIVRFSSNVRHVSTLVAKYFEESGCSQNLQLFSATFLRPTYAKEPKKPYIAIDGEAIRIADAIKSKRKSDVPLIEVLPGPGILTKYLEGSQTGPLLLYENNLNFVPILKRLPALERDANIKLYEQPAEPLWMYSISEQFIEPLPERRDWNDEIIGQAIIFTSSHSILRDLCSHVIHQNGVFKKGRIEFFVALPAADYVKLTCGPNAQYFAYRAKSVIFQILFEHEYLLKIDKRAFVPWTVSREMKKEPFANCSFENDYFYLTRIVPRQNLLSFCNEKDLMALSYFVGQCFTKRKSWIIPKLEKWIPGIGISLICNQLPAKLSQPLNPSADFSDLPKFSRPSMELSTNDHFTSIHTFTECGELTPEQMFTLFHFFKNLPAYSTSNFNDEVANSFMKPIEIEVLSDKSKRIVSKYHDNKW